MSKFTPGPWVVNKDEWGIRVHCKDSPSGLPFAVTPICEIEQDGEEGLSDARLISAAPDLYEALKEYVEGYEGTRAEREARAKAALAKADGK